MKLTYTSPDGSVEITQEVADEREAWAAVGRLQEQYEIHQSCGLCRSHALIHDRRTAGGYAYYELRCSQCAGRLEFGQAKEGGTLFLRQGGRGWYQYQPADEQ